MLALGKGKFSDCTWLLCDKTQEPSLLATPMDYAFNLQFDAWLQGKVRGRPLYVVGPWFFYCRNKYLYIYRETNIYIYIYILRERDKYLYIYRETNIYIYWERERERKSKIFFPREIHKILGYHRRNKGKNYVNFCDQMAGSWWYDWENHGICYHQILWKRKRNNLGV